MLFDLQTANLPTLPQLRQHPWSQRSIHSHSFVTRFFSHFGSGDMLLHHPLVFRPRHLQHIHSSLPALRKSQFASGQLAVDGWDAANAIPAHGV
jgi:alpha-N-acetylglucosamine transferase